MLALNACLIATTLGAASEEIHATPTVASPKIVFEEQVDTGVLILNGEYVPSPYTIQATDTCFIVNNIAVQWEAFVRQEIKSSQALEDRKRQEQHVPFGGRRRARWRDMGLMAADGRRVVVNAAGGQRGTRPFAALFPPGSKPADDETRSQETGIDTGSDYPLRSKEFAQVVARTLNSGDPVIHLPGEPVLVARDSVVIDSVYAWLASSTAVAGDLHILDWADCLPLRSNHETWGAWLASFSPAPALDSYIDGRFRELEKLVAEARSTHTALTTIDDVSYPLSVFGMLIAVMSLGHLLRSVPDSSEASQLTTSDRLRKATTIAVCLIAGLSMLDLVWTILAAQAGTMRELNPLGAQLIHDPAALAAFKVVATCVGCALLYNLRNYRRAADATWWMCLVMTVVTFRWVVFNSMFA